MQTNEVKAVEQDEVIAEIRQIRAHISAEHNNDIRKLCRYLRSVEQHYKQRVVTPEQLNRGVEKTR